LDDSPGNEFEIPEHLPLLPIRDAVVFPSMILPLFAGRDVSIKAIETAAEGDRLLALVTQRDPDVDDPSPEDLYTIGTVGMIMRKMRLPDGRLKVLVQGLSKVRVAEYRRTEPYIEVQVEDESALHAGHAGAASGGGHYRVTVVSSLFEGKNPVQRHRLVYDALAEEMQQAIHALALTTLTPSQQVAKR